MRMAEPQQADALVEQEIDRIANTPCPLAEHEQQIAELEREIDRLQRAPCRPLLPVRLQRTEEAVVVAAGAPREPRCPHGSCWV
jgi:hypothetical protein